MGTQSIQEENSGVSQFFDTYFYFCLGIYISGIVLVGFWNTYFGSLFSGTLDAHWFIHFHAIVFGTWLILYFYQTVLALKNKIKSHQNVGAYIGIPVGILLIIVGVMVTFGVITPGVGVDHQIDQYAMPLLASLGDLFAFAILFVIAIWYRKRPAFHKRFIVLATASLTEAPVARITRQFDDPIIVLLILFLVSFSPVIIAMFYDRWKRGSVHKVYWIGLAFFIIKTLRMFIGGTDAWISTSNWLIENIYPVVEQLM